MRWIVLPGPLLAIAVLASCAHVAAPAPAALAHTYEFTRYTAARDARAELVARGARVSEIEFDGRVWRLSTNAEVSLARFDVPRARSSCRTLGATAARGSTFCRAYAEASVERELMRERGWAVSERNYFHEATGLWAFDWAGAEAPRPGP